MNRKTFALLISLVLLLSACGGAGQEAPLPPASFHPHIVSYSASVRVPSGKAATVSASCKPGEQMLGGGFGSSDLFESAASIISSYPSAASTWTVTGVAASFFNAEVEVYCLQSNLPLQVSIVHATAPNVACPQNTVLLSEGMRSLSSDVYSPVGRRSYALCAARHATLGQRPTTAFNPHSSLHSYNPGAGAVTCPTGQVAVGGEYQGDSILGSAAGSSFTGWSVLASGDADVTITALCVIFMS